MKNKASVFLKQVVAILSSIAKAKSMAAKSKTIGAAKARLLMFSLMKNKKVLMNSISNKIHTILGHDDDKVDINNNNQEMIVDDDDESNTAMVLYMKEMGASSETQYLMEAYADDDKYPDLRHCLFDEEDDNQQNDSGTGSVIDIARSNKEEEGEDFKLEDEIDHVADLFIRRFHKQMRLQKLESFKRYQEMLQRSAA